MNRLLLGFGLAALAAAATLARADDPPPVLPLWPGQAPGEPSGIGAEEMIEPKPGEKGTVKRVTNVTRPTITVYRPAKDKNTGAAVLIAPGGGYNILAWEHEGTQVAEWLTANGVTGVLLKYRVPRRPNDEKGKPPVCALQDAQRAMGLVRSKASEWGLDGKRIGMLGFSAGGHLTAWTATNYEKRAYDPVDDADKVSCRPDFAVLVYPGGVVARDKDELAPEIRVSKDTPPSFFAHAGNDNVRPENSIVMYTALKKLGVPAELHIFSTGGHGFGMRKDNNPCNAWPQRCEECLRATKVIPGK
jgi:acetyl esterase/lipase